MMSYFLSLPRASWKARAVAIVVDVLLVMQIVQQWPHRHDDPAIARWVAWSLLIADILLLRLVLVVCFAGRLPKVLWQGRLIRTLPQIHADIARELHEQRKRSPHL